MGFPRRFALPCFVKAALLVVGSGLRRQVLDAKSEVSPTRLIILGNRNVGKSTLCQWLLDDNTLCPIHDGSSLQDTEETTLNTGYWFGHKGQEDYALEVLDTPGFLSLDDSDGSDWASFVTKAKQLMPVVDGIILVASATGETSSFADEVVNKLRSSFGTELWTRMWIFYSVRQGFKAGWGPDTPFDGTELPAFQSFWHETCLMVERQETSATWNVGSPAYHMLTDDIQSIAYGGAKLPASPILDAADVMDPKYAEDPMSDPIRQFLSDLENDNAKYFPTDVLANKHAEAKKHYGFDRLVSMRDLVLADKSTRAAADTVGDGGWDLTQLVPRMGPTEIEEDQEFLCKFPLNCELKVAGTKMSDADQLQIFPMMYKGQEFQCGDSYEEPANFLQPVEFAGAQRPALGSPDTERIYSLGSTQQLPQDTEYKICYCEFGNCEVPERFWQQAGILTVKQVRCNVECPPNGAFHNLPGSFCGNTVIKQIQYQEKVQYTCDLGYGVNHDAARPTFQRKCTLNFSTSMGYLTKGETCQKVECPDVPQNFARSAITSPNVSKYYYGDMIEFECDDGYSLWGDGQEDTVTMKCLADGQFDYLENSHKDPNLNIREHGCRKYSPGPWTDCDAECGHGVESRSFTCEPGLNSTSCKQTDAPHTNQCEAYHGCENCTVPQVNHASSEASSESVLSISSPAAWFICDRDGYTITGGKNMQHSQTMFKAKCNRISETKSELEWSTTDGLLAPEFLDTGCRKWSLSDWKDCTATCDTHGFEKRTEFCSTGNDADCSDDGKIKNPELQRLCEDTTQACEDTTKSAREAQSEKSSASWAMMSAVVWGLALSALA